MSKQHGILFKGEMVRAILRDVDPKEMTRRLQGLEKINAFPDLKFRGPVSPDHTGGKSFWWENSEGGYIAARPKYQPGDILYVKETYAYVDFAGQDNGFVYRATDPDWETMEEWRWKPSIFMPKKAARIWLEVTDVKCEQVSNISMQDAIDEGVGTLGGVGYIDYLKKGNAFPNADQSFKSLWISINGEETWNHWCFAYTFKRIVNPNTPSDK
jgi:hypothetical protein